jgi:hypothetical protein
MKRKQAAYEVWAQDSHVLGKKVQAFAEPTKKRKVSKRVHFAKPMIRCQEIPCLKDEDRRKSFYSEKDYLRFYVRECSRRAVIKLTETICKEQKRRLRNKIRAIPSYFIALNYLNAMLEINELGVIVKNRCREDGYVKYCFREIFLRNHKQRQDQESGQEHKLRYLPPCRHSVAAHVA